VTHTPFVDTASAKIKAPDAKLGCMIPFTLVGGQVIYNVHKPDRCRDDTCCIHNPSPHAMRHLPQDWDERSRTMFRVCRHDFHHPDPDDRNHYPGVHECECKCCLLSPEKAAAEIVEAMG
jgi:hypothetical protein